jgi:integrase
LVNILNTFHIGILWFIVLQSNLVILGAKWVLNLNAQNEGIEMVQITYKYLESLKPSDDDYRVQVERGLWLRISTTGIKTWIVRYRVDGKRRYKDLARFGILNGLMSLEDARLENVRIQSLAKQGVDFQEVQADAKAERKRQAEIEILKNKTIQDMFDEWLLDLHHKDGNAAIERQFTNHVLSVLGRMRVRDVGVANLNALYEGIVEAGKYRTATLIAKAVKQMFKWAERRKPYREILLEENPAELAKLKTPHDYTNIRDRVLDIEELKKLRCIFDEAEALYASAPKKYEAERPLKKETQLALWIALGSACRIGELLMAEWKHVDFEGRYWHIPWQNTKGQTGKQSDNNVYLSDFLLDKFRQLQSLTGDTSWLFPARYTDNHVCLKSVSKQVGDRQVMFKKRTKKLSCRVENNRLVLGEREWTPHDLRRTAATMMQALKVPRDIIHLCQNHAVGNTLDRAYLHHEYIEEKREAWVKLGNHLEAILKADNVVSIKRNLA